VIDFLISKRILKYTILSVLKSRSFEILYVDLSDEEKPGEVDSLR